MNAHGDAAESLIQLRLQFLIAPLGQRLLGTAQLRVLRDQPHDALQQLRAMTAARRGVEILLDHHGGEPAGAAEILHHPLQQFAGVRDVLPSPASGLREGVEGTLLDGLHVPRLLLQLLAAIRAGTAHDAAGVPRAVLLLAEVVARLREGLAAVGAGLVGHVTNSSCTTTSRA